jgi:RNA polymerase sigma-70 factor (ECF subfamily)
MTLAVQKSRFITTRWSVVLAAGEKSREALEVLFRDYWYPLYSFARRSGRNAEEARDDVQNLLAYLTAKNDIAKVDSSKGRFRSWLLACFKHQLANARDHARAGKRGGGAENLSLDGAEDRYQIEPVDHLTPEKLYARQWSLAMIERARAKLAAEYDNRRDLYALLSPALSDEATLPYAQIGERLGKSEGAVKVDALRMRRRLIALLRAEIFETVGSPEDVEAELGEMLGALE